MILFWVSIYISLANIKGSFFFFAKSRNMYNYENIIAFNYQFCVKSWLILKLQFTKSLQDAMALNANVFSQMFCCKSFNIWEQG